MAQVSPPVFFCTSLDAASVCFAAASFKRFDALGSDGPGILAAALDGIAAHAVNVVEKVLAIFRSEIQHGAIRGHGVFDRLAEMPGLRRDGKRLVAGRQLALGNERKLEGRGAADGFGEQSDHVVEISGGAKTAVVPGGIGRAAAHDGAGLAFGDEAAVHGRAHQFDEIRNQRIEIVIERIAERRREHHGAGGSGLVVVVHDLRKPLDEKLAIHVGRFLHVGHVEIAVVIVADVFLPQARDVLQGAFGGIGLAHVPVGNEFHAVRIGVCRENDDVVEDALGFRIVARDHFVDQFHELLRAEYFGGVQSAVDPDYGFAFVGERAGLVVRESFGMREPARDLFIASRCF